jgi:two-component system nitrogen regulation response regulator GlnG
MYHLKPRCTARRVQGYPSGNQARAALLLGIARRTMRQKLRELRLHVTHSVEANEGDLL